MVGAQLRVQGEGQGAGGLDGLLKETRKTRIEILSQFYVPPKAKGSSAFCVQTGKEKRKRHLCMHTTSDPTKQLGRAKGVVKHGLWKKC